MSGLQVVARADAVLRALQAQGAMTVPDLADAIDSPPSSTYRLLGRLSASGWVEAAPRRGEYRLGPYFLKIAAEVEKQLDVRTLARGHMEALTENTGCASTLLIARGDRAVCIERSVPQTSNTLVPRIGDSLPLFAGAGPLMLLAHMPESERERSLASYTGRDLELIPPDLGQRISNAASADLASSHDDLFGIPTLAARIWNHRDELVAALALHGEPEGTTGDDSAASKLNDTARAVSRELGRQEHPR
ncbi:IclR family transcriptional regulator [Brachybacterium paraconglomeratum]|uniref:IclR family transcriptional regulator n=1 Tax=Brachybacterium paraconglomeratum TaxID=173362 RepID=UPI003F7C732F